MGCCRGAPASRVAVKPVRTQSPSPCAGLEAAGDAVVVEVMPDGSLIPKTPYAGVLSLGRTLTILGCNGPVASGLRELEIAVQAVVAGGGVRARVFTSSLRSRIVSVGSVRTALVTASQV